MTIGDVFSAKLSLGTQRNIVQQRGRNKDFKALERRINNIFYPKDPSIKNYETLQNEILSGEAEDLSEIILKNMNALLDGKISDAENKEFINFDTFTNAFQKAQNTISTIQNKISDGTIQSTDIINNMNQLVNKLSQASETFGILQNKYKFDSGRITRASLKDEDFTQINQVLNLLRALGNLTSLGNYLQRRGLILEEIFGGGTKAGPAQYKKFVDGMAKVLAQEGINGKRIGQLVQRRGGSGIIHLAGVKIENDDSKPTISKSAQQISLGTLGSIQSSITYDPGQARQIKADVIINFTSPSGMPQEFRASLKNWSGIENKSLGNTSILAALDRTTGNIAQVKAYALSMISTNTSLLTQAHKMARLSILMDVITGFSQSSGYADTLLINTGTAIKVIDPRILINDVYGRQFLDGYNENDLESTGKNILSKIKQRSPGRSDIFLGNMFTYLAATKVSVMMNRQLLV